jgi:hypothetical protein
MSQIQRIFGETKPFYKAGAVYILLALIAIVIGLYFYSQALIKVEAPERELGEKVVVTLSDGKTIYTYENLIIEEDGKLLYKGENSTINLTGGVVVYEEWD